MKMFRIILSITALICAHIAANSQNQKSSDWNHLLGSSSSKDYVFYYNDMNRICLLGQKEVSANHAAEFYSTIFCTDVIVVRSWEDSGMIGDQHDIVVEFINKKSAISRNPDSNNTPVAFNFIADVLVPGTHRSIGIQRQDSLFGKPEFTCDKEKNRLIKKQTYAYINEITQINVVADTYRMRTFVACWNETGSLWSWEKFKTELKRIIKNDNLEFNVVPLHGSRYFEWTCGNELKNVIQGINFNY